MKIIKLLYFKYIKSLSICFALSSIIFFIFSLLGNLDEEYFFNIIIKISFFNSLQILTYVPAFIFLISVILFIIFLRSKNEMIIIKSYINIKLLAVFFLPIVIFFTILELNKKNLSSLVEDVKSNLINQGTLINTKIIINKNNDSKSYIVLKNINPNDTGKAEYRSFNIYKKKIQIAQFSDNLIFLNNTLTAKSFTQYKNNLIEDFKYSKSLDLKTNSFIDQNFMVKDISKNDEFSLDIRLINNLIFSILFFSYVFLIFLNKNLVSNKHDLKKPIFICLIILIYSFLIFNNSLNFYKQEFEFIASFLAGLFLLKVYMNE